MLIKCPECGKEISDKAEICIHCGYPLQEKAKNNNAPLKCDVEKNLYIFKKNIYDLTELVIYLKNNTFKEYEMDMSTWKEARKILKKICPEIENGDKLINYIKINRCIPDKELIYTPINNTFYSTISPTSPTSSTSTASNLVRCPKCGSTSVVAEKRGFDIMWGFLGADWVKYNVCQKCGHRWKIGR